MSVRGDEQRGRRWRAWVVAAVLATTGYGGVWAQAPAVTHRHLVQIGDADVREWLTTLSSDAMQGRGAFTEGYGMAAAYVSEQLRRIGATPLGADGTYLQPVNRSSYRVTRRSSVTVEANGSRRTFEQGEHVSFPALAGAAQTLRFSGLDFLGYGLQAASEGAQAPAGRLVVLLPGIPAESDGAISSPALTSAAGRAEALARNGAGAAIMLGAVTQPSAGGANGGGGNRRDSATVGLTTVLRVDRPRPPVVTGDEEFFDFLLAGAPVAIADLRERASRGQTLQSFTLPDVRVTIEIDHSYDLTGVERTHNVVASIPGSDPVLRDSYVLLGAHLDHVGATSRGAAPGRVNVPVDQDPIWNGADDDGSGSVAVLAIAKALVEGPRPKRSVLLIWHAAEEEGLLGSQASADDPVVPLERIRAVFNIDMIGRNRDNDDDERDTVYLIGADRISTDLHNLIVSANDAATRPLTIDYHYNDPGDSESFYTRSDHYSYASRGIPAAFFFTGTHPDYHANTDTVDKILFPKLVRITQLIYEAGFAVADHPEDLRRDHRGPRAGRGFKGRLPAP
jgi:hypothetical protein